VSTESLAAPAEVPERRDNFFGRRLGAAGTLMGGRDPPGQQRLAGGGEPFDLVELGPQLAGRAAADRVWVDRGDQLVELPADPNQSIEHVYDRSRAI
jgi:hypothetical protein